MTISASKILMIEDDQEQASLFANVLAMSGYEVVTVPDVEAALAVSRERTFDLALIDWDLPGIKGDAYILMAKVEFPSMRTVLFSNHSNVEQVARTVGADAWMLKIEGIQHLRDIIARLLQRA